MTFRVLTPIEIGEDQLTFTNVPENDAAEWTPGTYSKGQRVKRNHLVYESAVDNNSQNLSNPEEASNWLLDSATNGRRSFDQRLTKPSTHSDQMVYRVSPGRLTRAVAVIGAQAATATVRVLAQDDTELVRKDQTLVDFTEIIDPLAMISVPPTSQSLAVFEDVVCLPGQIIEVAIGDGSGGTSVSEILVGDLVQVGTATYGADVRVRSLGQRNEDRFGNVDFISRGRRRETRFPVAVRNDDISYVLSRLEPYSDRFVFAYFTADGDNLGTTVFGYFEELSVNIPRPNISDMEFRIIGVPHAN